MKPIHKQGLKDASFAFRIRKDILKKAKAKKLDVAAICRAALEEAIRSEQ